jgi:DNA-binding CsgD family transcriptional regulator
MRGAEMLRTILVYGLALAAGVFVLQWLEFRFLAQRYSLEVYLALLAIGFMALGIWVGAKLFHRAPAPAKFETNTKAQQTLGISEREFEVLKHLAAGRSNKEISAKLNVSPNTVKSHVAKLYGKLEVKRRTEAILRARELGILP